MTMHNLNAIDLAKDVFQVYGMIQHKNRTFVVYW
ncbi:MAG: hypothetical protein ACI9Y1_003168 [Lentisphaeria bacterium]|jgi:hypothetical protein